MCRPYRGLQGVWASLSDSHVRSSGTVIPSRRQSARRANSFITPTTLRLLGLGEVLLGGLGEFTVDDVFRDAVCAQDACQRVGEALEGKTVCLAFFEASTRTAVS